MDAKWIAIIVLALVVVFLFFRGESIRKSASNVHEWNKTTQEWAVIVADDLWSLHEFVCGKYPGECSSSDKKSTPPDPPPEFP